MWTATLKSCKNDTTVKKNETNFATHYTESLLNCRLLPICNIIHASNLWETIATMSERPLFMIRELLISGSFMVCFVWFFTVLFLGPFSVTAFFYTNFKISQFCVERILASSFLPKFPTKSWPTWILRQLESKIFYFDNLSLSFHQFYMCWQHDSTSIHTYEIVTSQQNFQWYFNWSTP